MDASVSPPADRFSLVPADAHVFSNEVAQGGPALDQRLLLALFEGTVLPLLLDAFDDDGGHKRQEHIEMFGFHGGDDGPMEAADFLQQFNVFFNGLALGRTGAGGIVFAENGHPLGEGLKASSISSMIKRTILSHLLQAQHDFLEPLVFPPLVVGECEERFKLRILFERRLERLLTHLEQTPKMFRPRFLHKIQRVASELHFFYLKYSDKCFLAIVAYLHFTRTSAIKYYCE